MMPASRSRRRARSSSPPARPPKVRFIDLSENVPRAFDMRPWPCRNEPKQRPSALKRPHSAPASSRPIASVTADLNTSWVKAADNATEVEWQKIRQEFNQLAQRSMSAAEAGVRLQAMLRRMPSLLSDVLGSDQTQDVEGERASADRREMLPLPLPRIKPVRESDIVDLFHSKAILGPKALQKGAEAWHHLLISALNGLDSHGNCISIFGPPTEAQGRALEDLLKDCTQFVADTKARTPTDFGKELGSKAQSYWGEPVYCAQELTLAQVIPTLPPKGVAASVDICKVLEGQLRDQLRDPESLLLPESEWPEKTPRAKTMLKDKHEWGSLATEMWQRDLTLWMPEELIFHHLGKAVVSGLFGVGKGKDVPGSPGLEQLRLICNLVPSNGFFREIRGDVDHLPYMMQWSSLVLQDDEVLLVSQEDMTCAFYLFKLPRAWCRYFAVGLPIALDSLPGNSRARDKSVRMAAGAKTTGRGYLVLQVLPMGWKSAVGIMQAVHRRILASSLAKESRLPSAAEIRKTAVMPASDDQRTREAWQVYLDNFASFVIAQFKDIEKVEGQAGEYHRKAREAWDRFNIPSAKDKSVTGSYTAQELGCYIDGRAGTLGTTTQRRLDALALSLFIIGADSPHRMWLAVVAGRWNFIFQFRRALSCVFQSVWRGISQWQNCRRLPTAIGRELIYASFLAPSYITRLRSRPDLLVTCSDASESGAGVAASAGLTSYGVTAAQALPKELSLRTRSGVALISLFGGIEAGRRALELLGVVVVRHITVENSKTANRVVSELYPDAVVFRDITEFGRTEIHGALAGVQVTFVLILAGFPCQGLSGANATKKGFEDDRSQLFYEGLRVVREVKAEKHALEFLFENVASMDAADRDHVSQFLGVRPSVSCASGVSQARRKRYLWASWQITEAPGVTVTQRPEAWAVRFEAQLPEPRLWLTPGWEMIGDVATRFPTFMRALPKKKETFLPAGIASTPPDARRRWKAHAYRYPPYQYRREFCLRHKRQARLVRVLNSDEREAVMFLGRGATRHAVNPTKAKLDPQLLEDERCSLIGNTFHAGVFALILSVLMESKGLLKRRPTPQDIVNRMGLYPSEVFVEGLACGLDRPPTFHRMDGRRRGHLFPSLEEARAARAPESSAPLEALALNALLRGADYRGSDVRLDAGELMKPSQWPRRSIDPAKWCWYKLLAHPYHDGEHINVLEVRAAHLTLRWRSRTGARVGTRFFHLLDYQVAIAVLAKGRSSSWKLNQVLRRIGALTVAAGFSPAFGYFMSEWNPSDGPSRLWEGGRGPRGARPRRPRTRKKPTKKAPEKKKPAQPQGEAGQDARQRRNQAFDKSFDSTLGYPGEGPARAAARRIGRSRLQLRKKYQGRGAERILTRRTSASRRAARQGIKLRDGLLAPITRRLYASAFVRLWTWAGRLPPSEISSASAYDRFLATFIEEAWETGATRGDAGNALSASIKVYPQLRGRGQLTESWYLLNAWARYEIPCRAPPMPVEVLLSLAWFFIRNNQLGGAVLLLVGFDCFLRTGELLSLIIEDISFADHQTGVVRLSHTKSGRRHAAFEASTVNDPLCGRIFQIFLDRLPRDTNSENYIFLPKAYQFYKLFDAGMKWLGLEAFGFKPYSIRRGGATCFFRATRNMEATLDRGRWASVRVARIYVNDGLAREVELNFTPAIRGRLLLMSAALRRWLSAQ